MVSRGAIDALGREERISERSSEVDTHRVLHQGVEGPQVVVQVQAPDHESASFLHLGWQETLVGQERQLHLGSGIRSSPLGGPERPRGSRSMDRSTDPSGHGWRLASTTMGWNRQLSYWLLVALLLVVGLLTIVSVGLAFVLVAIALVVLSPFRSRPRVFWSGLVVVLGFLVGYALVPAWCRATPVPVEEAVPAGSVVCRSLGGITYQGSGTYSPSLRPGLLAGAASGTLAGVLAWVVIGRRVALPTGNDL